MQFYPEGLFILKDQWRRFNMHLPPGSYDLVMVVDGDNTNNSRVQDLLV